MNAFPLDPGVVLQLLEGLLWVFVWAVVFLFGVELICILALWAWDGKQESASPPPPSTGA